MSAVGLYSQTVNRAKLSSWSGKHAIYQQQLPTQAVTKLPPGEQLCVNKVPCCQVAQEQPQPVKAHNRLCVSCQSCSTKRQTDTHTHTHTHTAVRLQRLHPASWNRTQYSPVTQVRHSQTSSQQYRQQRLGNSAFIQPVGTAHKS